VKENKKFFKKYSFPPTS